MTNPVLQRLLDLHRKDPKYISNRDIEDFFKHNRDNITYNDFLAVREYFLQSLGVSRYIFREIEKDFEGQGVMEHQLPNFFFT